MDDIFRKAVLTKQQIESIVDGVAMLRPKLFEDFEECKNGARISTTITKTSFEDAINKTSLVKQQIESELTGKPNQSFRLQILRGKYFFSFPQATDFLIRLVLH